MSFQIFKPLFNPKHRLIVRASIAINLLVMAWVGYQSLLSYQYAYEQARTQVQNLSHSLEEQAKSIFDRLDLVTIDIKNTLEDQPRKKWSVQEINMILRDRYQYVSEAQSLRVISADGNYYGSTMDDKKINNVSERAYFKAHQVDANLGLYISEPVQSKATGEWVITLTRRLNDSRGRFDGIVMGVVRLEYFNQFFKNINIGKRGNITLHTYKEFNMLARYPFIESKIGLPIDLPQAYRKQLIDHKIEGYWESKSPIDNMNKVFSFHAIPRLNLAIVVGMASIDFLSDWKQNTVLWVLFLSFSFLLHGFFLYQYLKTADQIDDQRSTVISSSKLSSLGEMAGGIAHEINNPLAVIQGRSEQIERLLKREPVDLEKVRSVNKNIQETTSRIARIVKGLKTFARNADNDSMTDVTLEKVIQATIDLCGEKFRVHGIPIYISTIPDYSISCRETQVTQVLINLLNNSYDAVRDLPEKWVKIEFGTLQDKLQIKVSDSGTGIPQHIREKIMNPFFTTKPLGQGTGLGLSISKSIIEQHKGSFYYNEHSPHTQFIIELPISKIQTLAA